MTKEERKAWDLYAAFAGHVVSAYSNLDATAAQRAAAHADELLLLRRARMSVRPNKKVKS